MVNATDGLAARRAALDIIDQVLERRRALDETLAASDALAAMESRDRAFARLLVMTTLRRLGQIDEALGRFLQRPLAATPKPAAHLLRLGATQLLFLGTPPHAAVATSVELAQGRAASWRKLINAVLRRLSEAGPAILAEQDAARLNTPDWLWRSWSDGHGEDRARAIAGAHLAEPPLDLSVKAESERWAAILGARLLSTGTLRLDGAGGIAELAGFADGAWWVQDAGAALPARLFGEVRGRAVIDLCCAPGGKTAQLAAAGAIVHAIDRSPKRLARVRANLDRLALDATLIEADATSWRPDAPAPCVLLDAPCSATGTIRRHPDVARLRTPEDIVKLAGLQARLLDAAARMVAPGGLLVYSTCSLEHDEGEKQIAAFLSTHREFTRRHVSGDEIGGHDAFITPAGDIRTLPCHLGEIGGIDGFYAARLHRQGN